MIIAVIWSYSQRRSTSHHLRRRAPTPVELGGAAAGEEGLVPQEGGQRVAEAQATASGHGCGEDVGGGWKSVGNLWKSVRK